MSEWKRLYESCTWATAYQSVEFVATWYESYKAHYSPILISERSSNGQLVGLIPLAIENGSKAVVVAGAHHAEYQTWLALPEYGNSFIEHAMTTLADATSSSSLSFKYLPPGAPMEWTEKGPHSWRCQSALQSRRIVRIANHVEVTDYLQKKRTRHTRNFLNRLRRLGELYLEEIREAKRLEPIFDQLITYYDMRQGAMHDKLPFRNDPAKKSFHLALLGVPNLLHVSIFRANDKIISALFGMTDRNTYSLGMPAFSPLYAESSPVTLHLLLLAERLHQEGFSTLDLTPGDEPFKERMSTHCDDVHMLEVFFRRSGWVGHEAKRLSGAAARGALRAAHIEPKTVHRQLERIARVPCVSWPSVIARKSALLMRSVWSTEELRVYVLEMKNVPGVIEPPLMARDRPVDLLAFEPVMAWPTRRDFLAESLRRLGKGHHCYTRIENGQLVHRGWLIEVQNTTSFPDIALEFQFPSESAVFYDSFTDPRWRGRGLYTSALRQMSHEASQVAGIKRSYVAVRSDNLPARHVIEKLGFSYVGSLYRSIRFGRPVNWVTKLSGEKTRPTVKWADEQI